MGIRTAVIEGSRISVGAGGAIVDGSDASAEWDEMMHKAYAVIGAIFATEARRAGP
jgi:para-aminobenzoate synthetase